ncbi:MAG: hypothetical protein AMJ65_04805 [Phycisphaerae bacterium SG8_4]|nr:MAG: hypothetical protein AMJ65_04805 [Phycisphaerae bacterium SG8_4]
MKENHKQTWEDMTLKSLEAKLRSLPEPGIPEMLEAKLHATIPESPTETIRENPFRRWLKAYGLWATAAAVVILAFVLAVNHGQPSPSHRFVADINDGASRYVPADQNAVLIEDTNFVNPNIEQQSP